MLKKLAIILAVISLPIFANAEIPAAKIAVVDVTKVMSESTAIKQANTQLQAKRDEYQKQITAQEATLKKSEEDLAKQKGILSKEALNEKQKQFIDQVNNARKGVQVSKGKLDKAHRDALVKVQVAIRDIVTQMATEQGFNVVLPAEPLIFAAASLDITAEVSKRLNEKLSAVELKFE